MDITQEHNLSKDDWKKVQDMIQENISKYQQQRVYNQAQILPIIVQPIQVVYQNQQNTASRPSETYIYQTNRPSAQDVESIINQISDQKIRDMELMISGKPAPRISNMTLQNIFRNSIVSQNSKIMPQPEYFCDQTKKQANGQNVQNSTQQEEFAIRPLPLTMNFQIYKDNKIKTTRTIADQEEEKVAQSDLYSGNTSRSVAQYKKSNSHKRHSYENFEFKPCEEILSEEFIA